MWPSFIEIEDDELNNGLNDHIQNSFLSHPLRSSNRPETI